MRNAGKIAVLCASVFFVTSASGCKKKFDPNDFDAGAAASASATAAASATTPPVDSSAAAAPTDAGDGLAPLVEGKGGATTTTHAATGGSGGAKPHGEPSECVQARHFCNELPPGERGKAANQKSCQDAKFACFNKGGHL
jgi:hypothetical protein